MMERADWTERISRAVMRHFYEYGESVLAEFTLKSGRRADVICLSKDDQITIIEVKSSKEDFLSDQKWPEYMAWADKFYFAVSDEFDLSLLKEHHQCGIIVTDGLAVHIERAPVYEKLAPQRRKHLIKRLALTAMDRASRQICMPEIE